MPLRFEALNDPTFCVLVLGGSGRPAGCVAAEDDLLPAGVGQAARSVGAPQPAAFFFPSAPLVPLCPPGGIADEENGGGGVGRGAFDATGLSAASCVRCMASRIDASPSSSPCGWVGRT